jgi:ribonuclease HII
METPTTEFEARFWNSGRAFVAGVDEVGMGCLAGPVVAAAVIFHRERIPEGLKDSKMLSAKKREELSKVIREMSVAHAVGWASVEEIDTLNIFQAARLAMKRAVESLERRPEQLLIDGRVRVDMDVAQLSIVKGDRKSVSIAAASIIAKVYRDEWMRRLDAEFPEYGFAGHKGYGSLKHRELLTRLGRCAIHRRSFSFSPV